MPRPKKHGALVIVESPAKAKTLLGILGPGYVVKACLGHVRDLPARGLGIDVENGFAPTYRTLKGRTKVLAELRAAALAAETVYLAPDPDREGEAIAWHLAEALKLPKSKARRVAFHEITRRGVLDAFQAPAPISMDRVNAQQARRVLDRLVGYQLSPLLWKKVGRGTSAGRVQSVAVRLVVEREREIRAFVSEEHWTLRARLEKDGAAFTADLATVDGRPLGLPSATSVFSLPSEAPAKALAEELRGSPFDVLSRVQAERPEPPRPPFTTSLLQQQASQALGFSASRTMRVAQQLYEGVRLGREGEAGLITYMRTDSFRVAGEALKEVRAYIAETFGEKRLPRAPVVRARRKGAQDAHEAIRPTSARRTPESLRPWLSDEQFRLYALIWKRFVASQMAPAVWRATDVEIRAGRATFRARGRELLFDGYTALLGPDLREDDQVLPPLAAGDRLALRELVPLGRRTEPPPRYTEATLVKTLEKHGIGRPSTYAPTLATIQERAYVTLERRAFAPTELGTLVVDRLVEHFDRLLDTGFTAEMEKRLDEIEAGRADWTAVLGEFYAEFSADLAKARAAREPEPAKAGVDCACGKPMLVRRGKDGGFLGCSGYPACKLTKPLPGGEVKGEACELCGGPMVLRKGRYGSFLSCAGYPACRGAKTGPRKSGRYDIPAGWKADCEKCGRPLRIKTGRRGGYIACADYPRCKNTRRFPRDWDRTLKAAGE
ncbi:MAG TPA: type I DNA topoisomerase [Planctomycetota bacterium]